jgi:uncharacterized protein (TIGR03000 family)
MRALVLSTVLGLSALSLGVGPVLAAATAPAPATIRVTLPADATLTVDGHATQSTSANRLFLSPPLEAGKSFFYTLKAEFVRDNKTITVEQKVFVQAGRETVVSLDVPGEPVSAYAPGSYASSDSAVSVETRASSYVPEAPAFRPPGAYWVPFTWGGAYGVPRTIIREEAPEGRSSSSGFIPPRWGYDPDDPFYPNL